MKISPLQWIIANRVMLINAGSLIATTGVTSVLGFAYWWVADRQFPAAAVGIASTSTSAMMLIGGLCTLGFSTLLITELPRKPELAGPLISTAMVVIGLVSGIVSVVFALIAPYLSASYGPLSANALDIAIFTIGIAQSAMTLVLDQALVGLLRGELQLWRNIVFAVVKLLGLFVVGLWMSRADGMSIYASWAFAGVFSMFVLLAYAAWKGHLKSNFWPRKELVKKLGLPALQHHLLNTLVQAPMQVLPLLVTALISATVTAWFYTAWMIANFLFLVPSSLTTVLHAMNAADTVALARKARSTMGLALLTCILVDVVVLFATKLILLPFGSSYATQAAWCLRILSLAAFPFIIKTHYISICRIYDRITPALRGLVPGSIFEVAGASVGAHFGGLTGVSLGWVVAIFIESFFMIPTVYRALFPKEQTAFATHSTGAVPALDDIWLADTMRLPIASLGYVGQGNTGAAGAIWLMDTTVMPAITKFRRETQALAAVKPPQISLNGTHGNPLVMNGGINQSTAAKNPSQVSLNGTHGNQPIAARQPSQVSLNGTHGNPPVMNNGINQSVEARTPSQGLLDGIRGNTPIVNSGFNQPAAAKQPSQGSLDGIRGDLPLMDEEYHQSTPAEGIKPGGTLDTPIKPLLTLASTDTPRPVLRRQQLEHIEENQ